MERRRPDVWSEKYVALYKMLAQDPEVERVLANPAIKKALCRDVKGDRSWLHKIRPVLGHNYHFHLRISCPKDSPECKAQPVPPTDEGCGKDLDWWFTKHGWRSRSRASASEADPDVGAAAGVQADSELAPVARHAFERAFRILADHRRALLGDHDGRRIGVAGGDRRHHRGVDHAEPSSPNTRSRSSTTASGSLSRPIFAVPTGWKIVVPTSPAALARLASSSPHRFARQDIRSG